MCCSFQQCNKRIYCAEKLTSHRYSKNNFFFICRRSRRICCDFSEQQMDFCAAPALMQKEFANASCLLTKSVKTSWSNWTTEGRTSLWLYLSSTSQKRLALKLSVDLLCQNKCLCMMDSFCVLYNLFSATI